MVSLATVAIIALIWIAEAQTVGVHRADAEAKVEAELTNQAMSLEKQLRLRLLATEQSLRLIESAWESNAFSFDIDTWRQRIPLLLDVANRVSVVNQNGIVTQTTDAGLAGRNFATRDYFLSASAMPADGPDPIIGSIVRRGPDSPWHLPIARRLDRPDGRFGGVVVASIDLSRLNDLFEELDLGRQGWAILLDSRTTTVLAAAGPPPAQPGARLTGTTLPQHLRASPNGVWVGEIAQGKPVSVQAFRVIPNSPLTVIVSRDWAVMMGASLDWEHSARVVAGTGTVMILVLALFVVRDLTRGRREQAQLRAERASLAARTDQLRATFAAMSDGIMMVDASLRLVEWNERFPAFTGVPASALYVGMPLIDILRAQARAGEFGDVDPEAEVNRRMALFWAAPASTVYERTRPNGHIIELRRDPLPSGGVVTLYSDITDRRLAEDRSREAMKMAAVGRLTAGIAHDFNNLLATIIGNAELLGPAISRIDQGPRRLGVIQQAARHGAHLIAQLMTYARKQPLEPARFDPNELIDTMRDLLRSSLDATVDIRIDMAPSVWDVVADPVQAEQAVLNLAINARDAMRGDAGTLTISTSNQVIDRATAGDTLVEGDYVLISVTDTGTGMPDEVIRNAFEPFFTTKAPGHGSGLGLSQVFGFARQSGGDIRIASKLEHGTTVTIYLPRAAEGQAAPRIRIRPEPRQAQGDLQPHRGATILLVDDQQDLRETVEGLLSSLGYQTIVAESGCEALRLMDQNTRIDAMLVDFAMPGMNGADLARQVRQHYQTLPIVFMSGYQDEERLVQERWVLKKPFTSAMLTKVMSEALEQVEAA